MRKSLFFGVILTVIIIGIFTVIFFVSKNDSSSSTPRRSNKELLQAIVSEFPDFLSNGEPVIQVDSVSQYEEEWYTVTIKSVRSSGNFVPVKVILLDNGTELRVITGPEIHFEEAHLLKYNVPDSVIIELQKE